MEKTIKYIVDIVYSNIYLLIFFIFSTLLGVLGYYERIAEKKWQKITLYILLCMYLLVNMGNFLYTSWKDNVSKNNQRVNSDVIEMLTTQLRHLRPNFPPGYLDFNGFFPQFPLNLVVHI